MTPYFETPDVTIYQADSRTAWRDLPEHSADAIQESTKVTWTANGGDA